ncbi:MAG: dihydropteroate synthase [Candidatus Freyarchaeota archaeon]|nr:dihydropteroate synthase [Candidatus Freyrarchaeum guaymaensis]
MGRSWCFSLIGGVPVGDCFPVRIMAVMNLSPESFYKGSVFTDSKSIEQYALKVEGDADILDVGASSSAPPEIYGSKPVSEGEELERVVNAVRLLRDVTTLPISVDTQRAKVAEAALREEAQIINDVSGFKGDPRMARVVADFDASCVLMACFKRPGDARSIEEARAALKESIKMAVEAGVEPGKIVIDPGIGFGKPYECDLEILRGLKRLKVLRRPVLVGVSRKHFIGRILGQPDPAERLVGSIAATAIAVYNGADVIRTHDAEEAKQAACVSSAISRGIKVVERGEILIADLTNIMLNVSDVEEVMGRIGVSDIGMKLMREKGVYRLLYLKNVSTPAALALKQHLLSVGGDAATPHGAIDFEARKCDVLLMATLKQLKGIIRKLKINAFGLPQIADLILEFVRET